MNRINIFFIILSCIVVIVLSYSTFTYVNNVSKAPVYACYYGTIEPNQPGKLYSTMVTNDQAQTAFFRTYCVQLKEDTGCPVTHHFGRYVGEIVLFGGLV